MTTLIPDPSHPLVHHLSPAGGLSAAAAETGERWRLYIDAATSALAVGILAFATLGGLLMAMIGLGLLRLGAPAALTWTVITGVGVLALVSSAYLARRIWRYEMEISCNGHPPAARP